MKPDLSLIPEPDRSTVARKPLSDKQRAALALAQGGRCGCGCGVRLDHAREGTIDEHLDPLALTGTNDLSNRALYRLPCAKAKTVTDLGRIAKAKRQGRETGVDRKRRQIPNRPFDKSKSRGVNGKVRARKQKGSSHVG